MPETASPRNTASYCPACGPSAIATSIAQFSWIAPPPRRFRMVTVAVLAPAARAMKSATAWDLSDSDKGSAPFPEIAAVAHEVLGQQHLVHFGSAVDQPRLGRV